MDKPSLVTEETPVFDQTCGTQGTTGVDTTSSTENTVPSLLGTENTVPYSE